MADRIATYNDLLKAEEECGRGPLREFVADWSDSERQPGEHPELAYRRGYQQGVDHVLGVLEKAGALSPALLALLDEYQTRVTFWRYPQGNRRRLRRHMRKDAAPVLNLDRVNEPGPSSADYSNSNLDQEGTACEQFKIS
jgi:hypothetical protein